jgi:predicted N-acyltransferase
MEEPSAQMEGRPRFVRPLTAFPCIMEAFGMPGGPVAGGSELDDARAAPAFGLEASRCASPAIRTWTSVVDSIADVDPVQWDACAGDVPLLAHAFFLALERSGTASRRRGVVPKYVLVRDAAGTLLACAPAMLKVGTVAEYGPEHLWLKAGHAGGCFAWPKFQAGVPFYPVRGEKLLVRPGPHEAALRTTLVDALVHLASSHPGLRALNVMNIGRERALELRSRGWLLSSERHCFWRNPGHESFDAYAASLPHRKRYQVLKERRRVARLGRDTRILPGRDVGPALLDAYYRGHAKVCRRYGMRPWLPVGMFAHLIERMPDAVRLIAAFDGDRYVAGIFCLVGGRTLYLRTWSALDDVPFLPFELICYRPIAMAIEQGLGHVDSGLIGMHKVHRGYAVEPVYSAHWFFDDRLRELARATLSAMPR